MNIKVELNLQAKLRAKQTNEEKELVKQKDRERKNAKRSNITAEEKEQIKEKDRLRKAKMSEKKREEKEVDLRKRVKKGEFAHKGEYLLAKDPRFTQFGRTTGKLMEEGKFEPWKKNYNKLKQRYSIRWRSDEEVEYYMITDLLNARRNRQP